MTKPGNPVRASWQFYEGTLSSEDMYRIYADNRAFKYDQLYFDHFNMIPTEVRSAPEVLPTCQALKFAEAPHLVRFYS